MAEQEQKSEKLRVVLFKGGRRVKQMLGIVLVFATVALGALHFVDHRMAGKTQEYRSEIARIQYENQVLQHKIQELDSARGVERIAQEELGMISKDTILIEAQVK